MAKQWLLLASVVTGVSCVSFGLSFLITRDWKQALSTSIMTLGTGSAAAIVAAEQRRSLRPLTPPSEELGGWPKAGRRPSLPPPVPEGGRANPGLASKVQWLGAQAANPPTQVAVFWDYENVKVPAQGGSVSLPQALIDYARSLGHPCLKIVYSNWQRQDNSSVQALYSLGFEPIHVSMGKANSVDVKLAVDCLDTAHRDPTITQFIIVTGDKDFIPLVNVLKNLGRQVTIIGRTERVSEQLLLSADEFVPLRQLLEDGVQQPEPKGTSSSRISYEEAITCLLAALAAALDQGKSTRFETIGRLMRDINSRYQGASMVLKEDGTTFSTFSNFVSAVEKDGKIRVQTTEEGFKELLLIEEDPQNESNSRPEPPSAIEREQWCILIQEVEQAFQESQGVLHFVPLLKFVTRAKMNGTLNLSHRSLRQALQHLIDVGILLKQEDASGFCLVEQLPEQLDRFLEELLLE